MIENDRTVLDSSLEILRAHGITKIFGNPGSNEIPFLAGLTEEFEFILGLHEQVVTGMAEGYIRGTGKPVLVNLHAASGSGNAMGALTNAHYAHIPMVIVAGQQVRRTVGQETMLASKDAVNLMKPLVKYSHEPLSANDVPRALSQAILEATTSPAGPTYLSVPLDDWMEPALAEDVLLSQRSVVSGGALKQEQLDNLISNLNNAKNPALVFGPQVDAAATQDSQVFESVMVLAEKLNANAFVAPSPTRCPFPTTHPNFAGVLRPGIQSIRDQLEGHDVVLVVGAPVFRYHRWEPSNYLAEGTQVLHLTEDSTEATRAPFGQAIIADVAETIKSLAEGITDRGERRGERGSRQLPPAKTSPGGMTGSQILEVLNTQVHSSIQYVNETTTLDLDYIERVAMEHPGMYHFPASGGLGFGLPVAVGLSMANADKTVVATVGDGSFNFGVSALYSAAQHRTRTIFVIVNNSGYGALAGFADRMGADNVPGLELGGIDFVSVAQGYGIPAQMVSHIEDFKDAYSKALNSEGPILIDARVV